MEEKKTMKERIEEGKQKAKNFWTEHKSTIIKGVVVTAIAVGGIVLFKKGGESLDEEEIDELEMDDSLKLDLTRPVDVDDEELLDMIREEHDIDAFETKLTEKFDEISDLCKEHNLDVGVFTSFGESMQYSDGCIEYFVDGTRIQ